MAEHSRSPNATRWSVTDRRLDKSGGALDLGVEPAIEADGELHTEFDRRKISTRWLAGTVLTGLAGAMLIGSAVYAALNERTHVEDAPDFVPREQQTADPDTLVNPLKGDRLVRPVDIVAARQTFTTPTIVNIGDREIVRHRTFTRVATTLALGPSSLSTDVPPFNPLKLLAGAPSRGEAQPDIDSERADADVTFVTHEIAKSKIVPAEPALSSEEVQAQIREHLRSNLLDPDKKPLPIPPQLMLIRTSRAATGNPDALPYATIGDAQLPSPFSKISVRMIPENVTVMGKTPAPSNQRDGDEKLVIVTKNQGLRILLREEGASAEHIDKIVRSLNTARRGRPIREGQKLKLLFSDVDGDNKADIARIAVYLDETLETSIAFADSGEFLQVEALEGEASSKVARPARPGASMRLYNSFYETALKHRIPREVIDDLVSIFANEIDFNRAVAGGDAFEVFYRMSELKDAGPEILYASISTRSETRRFYRAPTGPDGQSGFFDENGRSSQKFLIRKPVGAGEQRSGFGWRRHPILRYARMHTGVDWATRTGTPIVAAGNGTVIKAKRESGYGNRIEIQHANGYVTTYSHMVGYARGMREGAKVRQGQVIGYVGSTGLSTGPHLHYEVIVNGSYVDPLRIRLARSRNLTNRQLISFRRERDRIDSLIAKAPMARVAARDASN